MTPPPETQIRVHLPVFTIDDIYVAYVGACKHNIGLCPIPQLPAELEADTAPYPTKTDTVRFLYTQPFPGELVERLIDASVPTRRTESQ